ncbi:CxxH/CxxC protein [Fredinandcohnia humi]
MIKCCEEHVELALDIIVDEHEVPPTMTKIEGENELSTTCEFCQNRAVYVVGN